MTTILAEITRMHRIASDAEHEAKESKGRKKGKQEEQKKDPPNAEMAVITAASGRMPKQFPEQSNFPVRFCCSNPTRQKLALLCRKHTVLWMQGEFHTERHTPVFYAENIRIDSPYSVDIFLRSLGANPRTERIRAASDGGFLLMDSEGAASISVPQEAMAIQDCLVKHLGQIFDLDTAYSIWLFFRFRASFRKFHDVVEMLNDQNSEHLPVGFLALSEMGHRIPEFKFQRLLKTLGCGNRLPLEAKIYAAAASYLQNRANCGDSCLPFSTLAFFAFRYVQDHGILERKAQYQKLGEILHSTETCAYLKAFGKTIQPRKNELGEYEAAYLADYEQIYRDAGDATAAKFVSNLLNVVYLWKCYFSEKRGAEALALRLGRSPMDDCLSLASSISSHLDKEQSEAVRMAFTYRTSLLLGAAGTGKTRVISEICRILALAGKSFLILAPSAQAAHRAQVLAEESTGKPVEAKTIHRFIHYLAEEEDYGTEGGDHVSDSALAGNKDFIIIDEMSMCTLPVFSKFLRSISDAPDVHLLLVGDDAQLPAIGPQILPQLMMLARRLEEPEDIGICRLLQNYRAAKGEQIVAFAEGIRCGKDAHEIWNMASQESNCLYTANLTAKQFMDRFPVFAEDTGTMFLSAKNRDVNDLNRELRARRLNEMIPVGNSGFYIGDAVIASRNDYADTEDKKQNGRERLRSMDVYNGMQGSILSYDAAQDIALVQCEGQPLPSPYHSDELPAMIQPAYAMTVHKAQGAQADNVVVFLDGMENRNMLYTAVTRARKYLMLVGTEEAFAAAFGESAPVCLSRFPYRVLLARDAMAETSSPDISSEETQEEEIFFGTSRFGA